MTLKWPSRLRFAVKVTPPAGTIKAVEAECRRPDFVEGVPIVLGNGEAWHLPKPVLEFRLESSAGGLGFRELPRMGDGRMRDFGEAYWAKCQAAHDSEPGLDRLNAYATLAVDLLLRNYTLDDGQVIALLPYIQADDTNSEMWSALIDTALGIGPKARAGGEDS